jgi:hypothetical protein
MGLEGLTEMLTRGMKAWATMIAALLTALFGGPWRDVIAAGREWIWPTPEAEHLDDEAARIEAETDALLASMEPEDHVSLTRRFLAGDMTADVSLMGAHMASRVVSIKVQGLPHAQWSDRRLSEVIRGQDLGVFDRHLSPRQRSAIEDWTMEPAGCAV